jgi:hypothetical protein
VTKPDALGDTPEPDPRAVRPAELRVQLNQVGSELRGLKPGSPEQLEVLERFEPILGAVMALEEKLSEG